MQYNNKKRHLTKTRDDGTELWANIYKCAQWYCSYSSFICSVKAAERLDHRHISAIISIFDLNIWIYLDLFQNIIFITIEHGSFFFLLFKQAIPVFRKILGQ